MEEMKNLGRRGRGRTTKGVSLLDLAVMLYDVIPQDLKLRTFLLVEHRSGSLSTCLWELVSILVRLTLQFVRAVAWRLG